MIRHPKVGQYVQVRYPKKQAKMFPFHEIRGQIVKVGGGDGPTNCLVCFRWKDGNSWPERFEVFSCGDLTATNANEYGVFVEDVEEIEIFRKSYTYAIVSIAFEEGRWHSGYSLNSSVGGCGGGAHVDDPYPSRDEAILSSLQVMTRDLRHKSKGRQEFSSAGKAALRALEKQLAIYEEKCAHKISPPQQLDLFGAAA